MDSRTYFGMTRAFFSRIYQINPKDAVGTANNSWEITSLGLFSRKKLYYALEARPNAIASGLRNLYQSAFNGLAGHQKSRNIHRRSSLRRRGLIWRGFSRSRILVMLGGVRAHITMCHLTLLPRTRNRALG
jgi:hypothetical protein